MTGDRTKVEECRDKRDGKTTTTSNANTDTDTQPPTTYNDTHHPDHPGISYTKKGAMKQRNMQPPPSSTVEEEAFAHEEATRVQDHPGIGHTNNGAMKQPNIRPPPSTDDTLHSIEPASNDSELATTFSQDEWSSVAKAEYNFGNNFDVHPHANYAGPNLTRVIPPPDEEDKRVDLERIEAQGRHDHDLLHGGFPTGAPSPGIRPRSAEVVDRFDRG